MMGLLKLWDNQRISAINGSKRSVLLILAHIIYSVVIHNIQSQWCQYNCVSAQSRVLSASASDGVSDGEWESESWKFWYQNRKQTEKAVTKIRQAVITFSDREVPYRDCIEQLDSIHWQMFDRSWQLTEVSMNDWYASILIWICSGNTSVDSESSLSLKMTSGAQQRQLFLLECFPFFTGLRLLLSLKQ